MKWKRVLAGKCSLHYCWGQKWNEVGISKYWSGRIIYISLSKFSFHIDCRLNWIDDMITGNVS